MWRPGLFRVSLNCCGVVGGNGVFGALHEVLELIPFLGVRTGRCQVQTLFSSEPSAKAIERLAGTNSAGEYSLSTRRNDDDEPQVH